MSVKPTLRLTNQIFVPKPMNPVNVQGWHFGQKHQKINKTILGDGKMKFIDSGNSSNILVYERTFWIHR